MPAAFNIETIFNEYKDKVYRLALGITRNNEDAKDIMQNTFLKVTKNLMYFRNKSSLSTWIYRIAYNETLMHLRKTKRFLRFSGNLRKARPDSLFVNWSKLPDKYLLDTELKERINSSIRHMPIKYRMALLLDNVEELPLKESAWVLGLKINSLKTRLHRARLIVKQDILDYFKDKEVGQEKGGRKCSIWIKFIYDYATGNLAKRRGFAFRRHIKDCLNCNSFLDAYVKAIQITGALECQDIPLELKNKIETFLLSKHLK
jgi:RNA polymerase sigma-70 factor (ECF subfamily)